MRHFVSAIADRVCTIGFHRLGAGFVLQMVAGALSTCCMVASALVLRKQAPHEGTLADGSGGGDHAVELLEPLMARVAHVEDDTLRPVVFA